MRRRDFLALLGLWPLRAQAQSLATPTIGFLNAGSANAFSDRVAGFKLGLTEAGFTEGNLTLLGRADEVIE